jgi:hypothetical protein
MSDYSSGGGGGLVSLESVSVKVTNTSNLTYCWCLVLSYILVAWLFACDVHRCLVLEESLSSYIIILTCCNVIEWPSTSSIRLFRAIFTCFSYAFFTE